MNRSSLISPRTQLLKVLTVFAVSVWLLCFLQWSFRYFRDFRETGPWPSISIDLIKTDELFKNLHRIQGDRAYPKPLRKYNVDNFSCFFFCCVTRVERKKFVHFFVLFATVYVWPVRRGNSSLDSKGYRKVSLIYQPCHFQHVTILTNQKPRLKRQDGD